MNDSYSVKTGILNQFSTVYGSKPDVDEFAMAESQQLLQEILKQLDQDRFSYPSPLQSLVRHTSNSLQVSTAAENAVDTYFAKFQYSQTELLLQSYLLALKSDDCSESTIKNYRSDIRQFFTFTQENTVLRVFTKPKVAQFLRNEKTKGLTKSSIRRKVVSISQFAIWLELIGVIRMHSQQWLVELSQHFDEVYVQQLAGTLAAPTLEVKHPVQVTVPEVVKAKTTHTQQPKTSLTATLSPLWSRLLHQSAKKPKSPQVELSANLPKGTSPLKGQDRRFQLKQRLYQLQSRLTTRSKAHVLPYLNLLLSLILFLGMGYFGYLQIFKDVEQPLAFPSALTRPNRTLSFQGRLTDTAQNPILVATNMKFRLYDSGPSTSGGNLLWDSGTCSVTPDQDGIFAVGLGADCGSEIGSNVFSENANVWLQVEVAAEVLSPRQSIKSVAYALNSETLQGYPASASAVENTVIVMNNSGEIVLGNANPVLKATGTSFAIEAQTLTLRTTSGSNGNIVLDPDGTGKISLIGPVDVNGYIKAPGATLSATYAGGTALTLNAGPSATADIMRWQNSAGTTLGVIDAAGNIGIGTASTFAGLVVNGNAQANGFGLGTGGFNVVLTYTGGRITLGNSASFSETSIYSGTTEALRASSGNIGINSTTPSQKLDVVGAIRLGTAGAGNVLNTSASAAPTGSLFWGDRTICDSTGSCGAGVGNYWRLNLGTISPVNDTLDFLVGANASASAKFAVLNVNSGTPTASISTGLSGTSMYMTANGYLSTTNRQNLVIGNISGNDFTGDVLLNPNGTGNVGIGTTSTATKLDVGGTGRFSSTLTASNGFTLTTGALNLTSTSGALTLSGMSASSLNFGANNVTFTAGNFNTTATGINSTAIGATTPSTAAFTTLAATGTTTINTSGTANTTIGNTAGGTITIGAASGSDLALNDAQWSITGAGTFSGPVFQGNSGAVTFGNVAQVTTITGSSLTVIPTAWTATPTISGAVTMTSGFDSNAASTVAGLTIDTNGNLTVSNGTLSVTAPSTTGNAGTIIANSLTTGTGLDISSTSTAGGASGISKMLNIARSGANAQLAHTAYGIYSTVTNTNATSGTNIAAYLSASGATTANYGLIVAAGNVGIGTTAPSNELEITGDVELTNLYDNDASNFFDGGCSATTTVTGIDSTGAITCTAITGVPASSIAFSGITSGTNTTAAMVVGTGASLDYTGSGTINASSLIGGTWAIPGTIGSTTPNTGAFTTLTSSGSTTLGTGASTTNTLGAGASSINTIGSVTTPGALTLHGATTLDNTFTVSGSNLTTLGGNLTVTGTAWTATPTISGLITATSGLTADGTLTANTLFDANGQFTIGDSGDTGAIDTNDWHISTAGAMTGISGITNDGAYTQSGTSANTFTGTSTFSNVTYSALFTGGNVGIGSATPIFKLDVNGTGRFVNALKLDSTLLDVNNQAGTSGQILSSTATGVDWVDLPAAGANYWKVSNGTLSPFSDTLDLLVGSSATDSAKFAFMNVNSGTPTASIAGNLAIAVPTGANPATTYNVLNGGTFNLQTSVGGNAGLTSRLFVENSGFTGIGTTAPISMLHVAAGDITVDNGEFYQSKSPNGGARELMWITTTNNGQTRLRMFRNANTQSYADWYWDTVNSRYIIADTLGGSVYGGILMSPTLGTTLSVTEASSGTTTKDNTLTIQGQYWNGAATVSRDATIVHNITATTPTSQLDFGIAGSTYLSLLDTGNFGIGTTAPGSKLDVAGFIAAPGATLSAKYAGGTALTLKAGPSATGDILSWQTSAGSVIGVFDENGNVGIGNTAPSNELEVTGDVELTNLYDNDSSNFFDGGCSATTTVTSIDSTGAITCTAITGVPASSIAFSGITSGTNTTAAMVVGTGASLDYTGSGTINASSLIGGTWAIPGTIGSTTPNTGAFTTLTSSGSTTLGTGASSVNSIGSVTTPGALTLHGATTLDNTFTVSGSNLTTLGGDLTVTGTAWTATPTISGLITATSGLTANGALTANNTFTLGDNGDTGSVNTSDWDISTAGAMTGISGITNDSTITSTGGIISLNASSNFAVNIGTGTTISTVSIGGNANQVAIDSSTWDITGAGVASGLTGLTSSGTITFSGLTADRLVTTTTGGALTTTISSANAALSFSDETGSGLVVFGTSPTITDSIIAGSASFDLLNTTATTINFGGAASTLNIGPGSTTATSINLAGGSGATGCTVDGATGNLTCSGTVIGAGSVGFWQYANGALSPATPYTNNSDLLIGSNATASAKFAILNVYPGTVGSPTASISSGLSGTSLFMTADGTLSATNRTAITIGNSSAYNLTGNVLINSNNTGNVGIGTTNPLVKLDVQGSVSAIGTNPSFAVGDSLVAGNYGYLNWNTAGDILILSTQADGSTMVLTEGGNVGIGTTGPSSFKLQVAGNVGPQTNDTYDLGSDALRWRDLYLGGATLHIGDSTTDEGTISYSAGNILGFSTDATTNGDIAFFTDDLYLDKSSGNIGIGSITPGQTLDVVGDVRVSGLTASRAVFTNGTKDLVTSALSAALLDALTDETGTGVAVFGTSPTITDSIIAGGTSFDLLNTTATTINFGGAASTLNIGPGGATATSVNIAGGSGATGCTVDGATGDLNCTGAINGTGNIGYWTHVNGALSPATPYTSNSDLLIGSNASASAKFAVLNVYPGTAGSPTASVSSGLSGTAMFMTADGSLSTQNRMSLSIGNKSGNDTTGNVLINSNGTGNVGIGTTAPLSSFHANGSQFRWTQGTSDIGILFTGGTGYADIRAGLASNFSSYQNLSLNAGGGNVGIGTSVPTSKLQIDTGDIRLKTASAGTQGIIWDEAGAVDVMRIVYNGAGTGADNRIDILRGAGLGTPGELVSIQGTTGNVGIGDTTPVAKLGLSGGDGLNTYAAATIALGYGTTGNYPHFIHTRHVSATSAGNAIDFYTSDGTAAGVYPTNAVHALTMVAGNVGIGSTSPGTTLDVTGTGRFSSTVTLSSLGAGATDTVVTHSSGVLQTRTIDSRVWGSTIVDGSGTANYVARWTPDTNTLGIGTLYDDGTNVGIGIAGATTNLHIRGAANDIDSVTATAGNLSTEWNNDALFKIDQANSGGNAMAFSVSGTANERRGYIQVGHTNGAFANSLGDLALNPFGGNVGIGTTAPVFPLQVGSSVSAGSEYINVTSAAAQQAAISFSSAATQQSVIYRPGSSNDLRVYMTTGGDAVTFQQGGNVGIDTTAPNAKLAIGNNVATGFLDTYGEYQILLYDGGTAAPSYGLGIKSGTMVFNGAAYSFDTTGTATRMVIEGGGNVGIGTTTPLGGFDFQGSTASGGDWAYFGGNAGGTNPSASRTFGIMTGWNSSNGTGETELLYGSVGGGAPQLNIGAWDGAARTISMVIRGGNVGIASTANPTSELQIGGTTPELRIGDDGAEDAQISFMGNAVDFHMGLDDSTDLLTIGTGTALGTNAFMVMNSTGNVGIGTTSPGDKLHVLDSVDGTGVDLTSLFERRDPNTPVDNFGGAIGLQLGRGDMGVATESARLAAIMTSVANRNADLALYSLNAGTLSEAVRIQSNGNVGIGTSGPSDSVHVYRSAAQNVDTNLKIETDGTTKAAYLTLDGTHTLWGGINDRISGTDRWFIGNRGNTAGSLNFYTTSALTNSMTILSGGNVGIGETAPAYKLEVNGTGGVATSDWFRTTGATGIYFEAQGTGLRSPIDEGGTYGSVSTYGGEAGWEGYSIDGKFVFMSDLADVGLYNDINNRWIMYHDTGVSTTLYEPDSTTAALSINANGNVGIGTTAPSRKLTVETSGASNFIKSSSYGTGWEGGLILYSPRGTQATPTANAAADVLGSIYFGGYDTGESYGARIYSVAPAAWGGSATDSPTDIRFATTPDGSGTMADRMAIRSDGNVGIGSTAPIAKLNVVGTTTLTGGLVNLLDQVVIEDSVVGSWMLTVDNDGNSSTAFGVSIEAGTATTGTLVTFLAEGGASQGSITFNSGTVSYNAFTGGHYIHFSSGSTIEEYPYGTLLCLDSATTTPGSNQPDYGVSRCSSQYQSSVMGVYSQRLTEGENYHLVNAVGDGHVFVTNENGPVKKGDQLVSSSTPGYAMKAIKAGNIIGTATTDWDGQGGSTLLSIYYYPGVFYPGPSTAFSSEGELLISGSNGNYNVTSVNGSTVVQVMAASKAMIGKITAGLVNTSQLVVTQSASIADLSVNSLQLSGQNISDYIRGIVQDELQTTSLPPGSVAEDFTSDNLTVTKNASVSGTLSAAAIETDTLTATASAFGSLLVETATVSGDLTVQQDASVAGTLIAGTVNAESSRFNTLEARMAELEHIKAQTADLVDATISGTLYADSIYNFDEKVAESFKKPTLLELLTQPNENLVEAASPASIYEPVETAGYQSVNPDLIATDSAILSLNESDVVLGASALFVEKYLEVNGHAYVAQSLGIGDTLKIGNSLVITNGTIDYHPAGITTPTLAIQSSGQGKLDFLAGVMTIENGLVAITGDIHIAGKVKADTLLTNLVQPADFGNPFQVQVAGASTESGEIKKTRFEIINETGQAVASFDADGNASFQGGVSVGNQNLIAEDSSDDIVTTDKSSGKAKLTSGKDQLKIQTPKATPDSLIYVTPKGSTENKVLFIKGQGEGDFTVGFDSAIGTDVEFNWWIVN